MMIYEDIFSTKIYFREFNKKRVRYIIVGGLAVTFLGSLRNTADMDILVEMSDENLRRIVAILKRKGYKVKQPVDPMDIADKRIRSDWIKNKHMKAFNFYKEKELKEVDIIIESPVSFKDASKDIEWVKSDSLKLPVISADELIKMKKDTARLIDRFDIEELRVIKRLSKNKR